MTLSLKTSQRVRDDETRRKERRHARHRRHAFCILSLMNMLSGRLLMGFARAGHARTNLLSIFVRLGGAGKGMKISRSQRRAKCTYPRSRVASHPRHHALSSDDPNRRVSHAPILLSKAPGGDNIGARHIEWTADVSEGGIARVE